MKLRYKLIFRTVALAALVFGAFGAILIQSAFQLQLERERHTLEERSAYLAQSMEAAAVNYVLQNIAPTGELLSDILAQLDGTAALHDTNTTPPEAGMYLSGRTLNALRPVQLAGRSYLIMAVSDLSALYEARRSLLTAYVLLYAAMMVFFSAAMLFTARSLSGPIEHLAEVSGQLAEGQLTARAQPDDTHETRALALSFNQMADFLTGQIDRQQRFIADLTHEMKTPLTAIIGHADLIRSGRVTGDGVPLAAQHIFKEGQRLNSLSARLIDLILLDQDPFDLRPAFIRPLVEETVEALRPAAVERGIELTGDCVVAVVHCDPPLFSSLLSNLIDNALKSGAKRVCVEGCFESDVFTLTISDDGRGMDQAALQRITEPFYRVDKSRSRAQGGAGLGLALCARIARLHHALLSFESEPGKGTRVTLSMLGKEAANHEEI